MSTDYTIRAFEQRDLARLHEIRDAAFKPVFRSFREIVGGAIAPIALAGAEDEQAAHLETICSAENAHKTMVVELDNKIVAFCAVSLDHATKVGEIDLNAVDPEYQGRGIGAAMYDHALMQMRDAGMQVATVGTGGDPSHAPARRAYEKAGFGPSIPNLYYYRAL